MLSLPTIRHLQFLLALHQQGSFHAAAVACGVTQSTLSAGIQDMEDILGQPVIDRTRRRQLTLTPLGQDMLVRGEAIVQSLHEITVRARHGDRPFAWPVRLGIIPTLAPYVLPRIVPPLQAKFPQLVLQSHELQSRDIVAQVQNGDLDAGLIALPFPVGDLQTTTLYSEKLVCAVPKNAFRHKARIHLSDINPDDLLLLSEGHCLRDHVLDACGWQGKISANPVFSTTSLSTILELVAHGHGITLLPQMAADSRSLPATIRILPFSPAASREVGLIWRHHSPRQADLQRLAKSLKPLLD